MSKPDMSGVGVPFTDWDQALLDASSSIDRVPREWLAVFAKQDLPFMDWMQSYLGYTIERTPFGFQRVISTAKCPSSNRVRNCYWYLLMTAESDNVLACEHCWDTLSSAEKKSYQPVFVRRGTCCSLCVSPSLDVVDCVHRSPHEGRGDGLCQVCHVPVARGKYCGVCAANVQLCPCGRKLKQKSHKKKTQ